MKKAVNKMHSQPFSGAVLAIIKLNLMTLPLSVRYLYILFFGMKRSI
jgi:hypothetical protein